MILKIIRIGFEAIAFIAAVACIFAVMLQISQHRYTADVYSSRYDGSTMISLGKKLFNHEDYCVVIIGIDDGSNKDIRVVDIHGNITQSWFEESFHSGRNRIYHVEGCPAGRHLLKMTIHTTNHSESFVIPFEVFPPDESLWGHKVKEEVYRLTE